MGDQYCAMTAHCAVITKGEIKKKQKKRNRLLGEDENEDEGIGKNGLGDRDCRRTNCVHSLGKSEINLTRNKIRK